MNRAFRIFALVNARTKAIPHQPMSYQRSIMSFVPRNLDIETFQLITYKVDEKLLFNIFFILSINNLQIKF